MKYISLQLFLIPLLFLFSSGLMGQTKQTTTVNSTSKSWFEMMQDPNAKFSDVCKAFYDYKEKREAMKKLSGQKSENEESGDENEEEGGMQFFYRWEYINSPRVLLDGKLPAPGYIKKVYNNYMSQKASTNSASGNWNIVGPVNYPNNVTTQPTGMGRINTIAFHPADANTIFIGAPNGGIWKTTDGGSTWTNLSSNIPYLGVSAILVHPTNPSIIYIGSGDRDGSDAPGMGIFRSTDGGSSWVQLNNSMGNAKVGAMIMHPIDPNTIIAATSVGIYKTTNGGSTWSLKASGNYKDIKFKPGDPSVVYATEGGNFYRSTNTGESWTKITSGVILGKRLVIGVTADNPSVVYLVQTKSTDETFAGIMKSTDSGVSFITQSTSPNIFDYACNGSGTSTQATYDLCIAVDPVNANVIYVGSINNWKSTDGGLTWNIVTHWVGSNFAPSDPTANCAVSVHADQHWFEWSPLNGRLYVGNDGGIYYTSDNGATWPQISSGIVISQIYKIGQSATNNNLVVNGYQDNGAAILNGTTFTTVLGGDAGEGAVDFTDANYRYNAGTSGSLRRTTTGGTSFATIASKSTNGITGESSYWIFPYCLHESDPTKMFLGYVQVYRSDNVKATSNTAVSWSAISSGETVTCRVIENSPADNNVLYVYRSSSYGTNASLKRTDNANTTPASVTWINCTLPSSNEITDIEAHPTDANIVYVTAGYNVYKSTDKGLTWTNISGNLPPININCLVYDKSSPNAEGIYIGNETGVWFKNSSMSSWMLFSSGLPPVDIRELEIYYDAVAANSRIKAATYGRGLWQSDLAEVNVVDPNGFTATPVSSNQINLAWVKNATDDNVLIATSPISTFGFPVDGTTYSAGNTLSGGGTIIYNGPLTSFNHTLLTAGTTYYYKIWSVNGSNQYSAGLPPINAITYSHAWIGTISTDWFTPGNWGTNAVPTSTDNVYIPAGTTYMPQINGSGATCANLFIESGASLTMNSSTAYTLSVSGNWTNNGVFTRGIGTIDFNGSNLLQTIGGTSTTDFYVLKVNKVSIDNTLEAISPITLNATTVDARLQLVSGTFKLSNSSSNIIAINNNGFSTDIALGSGKRFWINSGTLNVNTNWRINAGELKITGGTVNIGTANNVYCDYLNNGKLTVSGGQLNISAGIWGNASSSTAIFDISGGTIVAGAYYNGYNKPSFEATINATFNMSGGIIIMRKPGATGAGADYQNLSTNNSVTGGTLQIGDGATPASQTIRINSTVPVYNLVVNATNSPVAQLVTNGLTVKNDVTISGGTLNANGLALNVGGNLANSGTFTPGLGTVTFNGTAAQTISGNAATTFNSLTLNNDNGLTLGGSVNSTVNGTLSLTSGVISTGSNKLIIGAAGSVSRTSGHIFGNLQKNVATGTNVIRTFEIGDAAMANYTPVSVTFASVSTAGDLIAKTSSGDHPNIATSTLIASKSVNRNWTLTNSGVGFTTYDGVFNFLSGDVDVSANTSNFICGKYTLSTWTYPTLGAKSANTTQITGVSSFGDFQLAEGINKSSIASGGNWSTDATWSPSGVPVSTDNVSIVSPGTVTVDINNAVTNDLTIQSGAKLTINPNKALTISGSLTNNAGTSGLVVQSDVTGTGSLIHSTANVDGTFERYLNNADWADWKDGWHFLSSPIALQAIDPDFTTIPDTDYDFYTWYEAQNVWVNFKNTSDAPTWLTSNNSSLNFIPGKGYLAAYNSGGVKQFKGTLNVTDIPLTGLTINGTTATNRSWHLLGNPFASAITWDASAPWNLTNIGGVAKIWNEANQSYSDLSSTPASYIPATNGFMVEVASGTGSLTLPASKRVHSTQSFYKSANAGVKLMVRNMDYGNAQESNIVINPMATESFDLMYDGEFFAGYAPMFYSLAGNEKLSTNSLPQIPLETGIPFAFIKNEGKNFQIEAKGIENLGVTTWLLDKKSNIDQNITLNPVYTFTASSNDIPERFLLHFSTTVGVNENQVSDQSKIWYFEHKLIVTSQAAKSQLEVIDLEGRIIMKRELNGRGVHTVVFNYLQGFYVARLTGDSHVKTTKFIVN